MNTRTLQLNELTYNYLLDALPPEDSVVSALRRETATRRYSQMQIAPEQAQLMALLALTLNARRTLEIGVFTGYSTLAVARALPEDGRVVALDIDEEATEVARRYWEQAGVANRIDLRIGPALDSLAALKREAGPDQFDFAFIDADKLNYQAYFDYCVELVRPGGLIAVDNVLWSGLVANPSADDETTEALRAFNSRIRKDKRVDYAIVPIADGLTLARVRPDY